MNKITSNRKQLESLRKKAHEIDLQMRKLRQQFLMQQREKKYKNICSAKVELLKLFNTISEFEFYQQLITFVEKKNLKKVYSLLTESKNNTDI
ncbi:hypothetical protein FCS83_10345 [Oenococcus sp. UCMA 17063]|nr:hypothetical protein [Oenococcus sp. UCMA 17063]